jgi:hypothetical protein
VKLTLNTPFEIDTDLSHLFAAEWIFRQR